MKTARIGLIGAGGRGAGLAGLMLRLDRNVRLAGVADKDDERPRLLLERWGVKMDGVPWYRDDDELLEHAGEMDGIIIATRCHQHTPMALKAARTRLPLYLEKPVAINRRQLRALHAAFRGREDQVVVSFPLRLTPVFRKALKTIRSGRLGVINQVQALNNVPYGGHYYGGHYRNYDESGGLWLQKATHDFDCINLLVGTAPEMIAAMTTHKIYGGNKPRNLRCSACNETATCLESPQNLKKRGDPGGMCWDTTDDSWDHYCAFSRGIRNQDAGSALIRYAGGVHAMYSQNFVTRLSAGRRGAIITGYMATLEFDYNGKFKLTDHHKQVVEETEVQADGTHGGGDDELMKNFLQIVRGKAVSKSCLRDGILSVAMCLAARESSETGKFRKIVLPGHSK